MFEGFEGVRIETEGATISAVYGGERPPVLLLHGYPQTLAMWHLAAPLLAESFTVVAADLRGYGDSSKPDGGRDHSGYSKRTMATDQVEVMRRLGFDSFAVVGHDRGGRVAHRMALDHPQKITQFAVLDIVPTHWVFATANKELATYYYHWFFLTQSPNATRRPPSVAHPLLRGAHSPGSPFRADPWRGRRARRAGYRNGRCTC